MKSYLPTTPFGRRPFDGGQMAALCIVQDVAPETAAHKWKLFREVCAARVALGVTERALTVLEALLSFHGETVLSGGKLVVFPSNEQLVQRAKGMPGSTLRRHLASLVEAGLVIRRDSPNGKRFARKGEDGSVETAYGFDLSPLVARAAEIERMAAEARAADRVIAYARERITICRRDISKVLAAAEAQVKDQGLRDRSADVAALHARFREIVGRIPRRRCRETLEAIGDELTALAGEAFSFVKALVKIAEMGATGARNKRHIESSDSESKREEESVLRGGMKGQVRDKAAAKAPGEVDAGAYTLRNVLEACPDILDYASGGIGTWQDMARTAHLVSGLLGISPAGWKEARAALGECGSAAAIAYILQRSEAISNAGGYLRRLSRKQAAGEMSIDKMVTASLAARRRALSKGSAAPVGLSPAALRLMMGKGVAGCA